jgi:hypothetical protein
MSTTIPEKSPKSKLLSLFFVREDILKYITITAIIHEKELR